MKPVAVVAVTHPEWVEAVRAIEAAEDGLKVNEIKAYLPSFRRHRIYVGLEGLVMIGAIKRVQLEKGGPGRPPVAYKRR